MSKRILSALLCCLIMLGCFGATTAWADEGVTLEFWTVSLQPTFTDYINGIISEYEAAHPGVKINWVDLPYDGYKEKLVNAIVAGNPPDVVNLWDTLSFKEATPEVLVNLYEEATAEQLSIYSEAVLQSNELGGGLYGFPWYASIPVMMYNTELFAAAGFDAPPKTISEMLDMAPQFKEKTGAYIYLPSTLALDIHGTVAVLNADETAAAFNTPELVTLLKKMQHLIEIDALPRGSWGEANDVIMYAQGKVGMLSTTSSTVNRIANEAPDKYDVTAIDFPLLTDLGYAYTNNYYLLIPKGSKHHQEAIDFANVVTNDKNQLEFCKLTAIFPTTKEAVKDSFFTSDTQTTIGKARAMSAEVAGYDKLVCVDAMNVRFDLINGELNTLKDLAIFNAGADVQAQVASVEAEVNKILLEEQAN